VVVVGGGELVIMLLLFLLLLFLFVIFCGLLYCFKLTATSVLDAVVVAMDHLYKSVQ